MVGEKPLGLSFLATLELAFSIIQINLGALLFIVGNPLPGMFPDLNVTLTGIVLLGVGIIGLLLGYYMWSGQAFGWIMAVSLSVADLIIRILLVYEHY